LNYGANNLKKIRAANIANIGGAAAISGMFNINNKPVKIHQIIYYFFRLRKYHATRMAIPDQRFSFM
jgi:hypothetical protein